MRQPGQPSQPLTRRPVSPRLLRTDSSPLLRPLLNGLLGSSINLTVGDMKGLASANTSLLGLVDTDLGAGTPDELIRPDGVKLGDFYVAIADVLSESPRTQHPSSFCGCWP